MARIITVKADGYQGPGAAPPSAPSNLAEGSKGTTNAILTWSASVPQGNATIVGYNVYKDGVYVTTVATLQYDFTGLTINTAYTFGVEALDSGGQTSTTRPTLSITTQSNAQPVWTAQPVTQYRKSGNTDPYDFAPLVTDVDGNPLTFSISSGSLTGSGYSLSSAGLVTGTGASGDATYTVTVSVTDGITAPVEAVWTLVKDNTAPSTPVAPTLSNRTASSIDVSWTNSTDSGSGYGGMRVYKNAPPRIEFVAAPATSYTITGLTSGETGTVYLEAYDLAGNASATSGTTALAAYGGAGSNKIVQADGGGSATHTTLASLTSGLAAGDTVTVNANTPGGTQNYSTFHVVSKNGSFASPINISARSGDSLTITTPSSVGYSNDQMGAVPEPIPLYIRDSSYVNIRNKWSFGTATGWNPTVGRGDGVAHGQSLRIANSHHITLDAPSFDGVLFGGYNYYGNLIDRSSYAIKLRGYTVQKHGTNSQAYGGGVVDDWGDQFFLGSRYTVVQDGVFKLMGHVGCFGRGSYHVYRNMTFDGDWRAATSGFATNTTSLSTETPATFQHPVAALPASTEDRFGIATDENGTYLFENCHFKNSGPNAEQLYGENPLVRWNGYWVIFRNCVFTDCDMAPMMDAIAGVNKVGTSSGGPHEGRIRMYNCTSYNTGGLVYEDIINNVNPAVYVSTDFADNKFKNNIFQQVHPRRNIPNQVVNHRPVWTRFILGSLVSGYPNGWKGTVVEDNVFGFASDIGSMGVFSLTVDSSTTEAAITNSTTWPNNIRNNTQQTITFTTVGALHSRAKSGFLPTTGTGVGVASLTTATNAGSNSTTLTVADPYWFRALGTYLADLGEVNDTISIGGGTPVQISSINHATSTITLSSARTWANGAGVQWCLNGNAVVYKGCEQP